ncbi:MAG: NADH-quinone oxidoreductase subunit NuoN [Micrococcales bacterium]|nr:NADH-quinone oxidoreductase subunit NuoN [Micrococcales bacterium]
MIPAAAVPALYTPPQIDYLAISPMLLVFAGALLCVLVETFVVRRLRHTTELIISLVSLVAALAVLLVKGPSIRTMTLGGAVVMDGPAVLMQAIIVLLGGISLVIMVERFNGRVADAFTPSGASIPGSSDEAIAERLGTTTEIFPLALFAIGGMMIFPASGDLLTMFVALEILSMPLYVLTAIARRRRLLSQEASLKYFLLGSFSSAFFLFGAALLYGYAGSVNLSTIAAALPVVSGREGLLIPGIFMLFVGLLFKVGAVPFHSWTPDVYQGAPTPVTGFMAACTKAAAFGAMLRLVYVGVAGARWDWQAAIWVIAALTMIVGSVLSVTQTDMKRLLAYSSIAHAGFILVGVMALDQTGVSSVTFYVAAYGFATIAAFGLIMLVRSGGSEATHIGQWAGLGKQSPLVAGGMAILLMAFAGIPLTSGFTAKFAVFTAAIGHAGTPGVVLVVIGVLCSAITAFVYFRIVVLMFFSESDDDSVAVLNPSVGTSAAIALGVLVTVLLGVIPAPLLAMAADSAQFLR